MILYAMIWCDINGVESLDMGMGQGYEAELTRSHMYI